MLRITETVKHLIIINVLMYFGTTILGDSLNWDRGILAIHFPIFPLSEGNFRPFQIVSHMFMHGDFSHLLFNMFGIYIFGTALETYWGAKKFLFFYLFTGFGAMTLYLLALYIESQSLGNSGILYGASAWGASGALFGLLIAYAMKFPDNVLQLIFPPIALKAKYFALIYAGIELYLGMSGANTGVAHFAHLGGALFGYILTTYWTKNP